MRIAKIIIITAITLFILITTSCTTNTLENNTKSFDPSRALKDVAYQLSLGPRILGSKAHQKTIDYIIDELSASGWEVILQDLTTTSGIMIQNIVAKKGQGQPWIVLGAHYDSRFYADRDPDPQNHFKPVPGANDGASGVAILLEIGRILPENSGKQIWLVFFDAEDNGNIDNYDWIMGSKAFVSNLSEYPDSAIIIDMVGDRDLTLFIEQNSDKKLAAEIWDTASSLGKYQFINQTKYSILDDHTSFLEAGVPAIDIIDFNYKYWHTTADTFDKISEESLSAVGETLFKWLIH